jgi:hypothetical protein
VRKESFIREAGDVGGRGGRRGRGYQGPVSNKRRRGEYRLLCFSLYATNISFCHLGLEPPRLSPREIVSPARKYPKRKKSLEFVGNGGVVVFRSHAVI